MNSTTDIVSWAHEPQGRGTIGLLWSCLITIFLCTWSAIHPNIPAATESLWDIFWRRQAYMLLALVAPEFLALCAVDDFLMTRTLRKKVDSLVY